MTQPRQNPDPAWLNRDRYPFRSRYLDLALGRLHYVDEGQGRPVVFVHGNPTWSYLFRHVIIGLREQYRCIALDHLGFGLSDRPATLRGSPAEHARNLAALLEHLELEDLTLVLHDWGGPIGLRFCLNHPARVSKLVISNSWMWPVWNDLHFEFIGHLLGGWLGRQATARLPWPMKLYLSRSLCRRIPSEELSHYLEPLKKTLDRRAAAVLVEHFTASSDWLADLWTTRASLRDKPALVLWGMRDRLFRKKELRRWLGVFDDCRTIRYREAGNLVFEDLGAEVVPVMQDFLSR